MNHAATLWFGAFRTPVRWRRTLSPRAWTCVGALAMAVLAYATPLFSALLLGTLGLASPTWFCWPVPR
jgi:hypothetical protein